MPAHLIVRAQIPDPATRSEFDHWYAQEHLPEALEAFGARSAWRGWSDVDPELHYAFYEFETLADARQIAHSDAISRLGAEFDRLWEGRVTRTREIVESIQAI